MILTIRTDKPEAELGFYDAHGTQITHDLWEAHRKLAETIHQRIVSNLNELGKGLKDIQGIVVYGGPGSFTGLRIGVSVGNALAYSQKCPIVAMNGRQWQKNGIDQLESTAPGAYIVPIYDEPARTTTPRK